MNQCDRLKCVRAIEFKNPATGRKVRFKAGEVVWVQNPSYRHADGVMLGKLSQPAGAGYLFSLESVREYFTPAS